MASIVNTGFYTRLTEKQPTFDFMIKKDDFYINTHGVSVTEYDKSYTNYGDGLFYVLNNTNKPIYFDGIYFSNIKLRKDNGFFSNVIKMSYLGTRYVDDYMFDDHILNFRGRGIGKLTIGRLVKHANNSNVTLNPFQSIELSATYTVLNLNNLDLQYYGKSKVNQNRKKGTIDINFNIKCYLDKALTKPVTDTITFSVNTVNSGYVPISIQQPNPNS